MLPSDKLRIVVATRPVDFRKGHDGLAALVQLALKEDPFTGTVFVFRKRSLGPTFRAVSTSARHSVSQDRECVSQCAVRMRFSERSAWRSTPRGIGAGRTR